MAQYISTISFMIANGKAVAYKSCLATVHRGYIFPTPTSIICVALDPRIWKNCVYRISSETTGPDIDHNYIIYLYFKLIALLYLK